MQEFLENHFNNMAEENYSDISDGKSSLYVNCTIHIHTYMYKYLGKIDSCS